MRRQPEGAGPTFAAERVPGVAGQRQEVPATSVPVRGAHTVQQSQEVPRSNGKHVVAVTRFSAYGYTIEPIEFMRRKKIARGVWLAGLGSCIAVRRET